MPKLRDPSTRRATALGAVIAVVAAPFLPAGLPVLLALLGLLAVVRLRPAHPTAAP
jgi:predicted branched-subunit amino acid permease